MGGRTMSYSLTTCSNKEIHIGLRWALDIDGNCIEKKLLDTREVNCLTGHLRDRNGTWTIAISDMKDGYPCLAHTRQKHTPLSSSKIIFEQSSNNDTSRPLIPLPIEFSTLEIFPRNSQDQHYKTNSTWRSSSLSPGQKAHQSKAR